MTIRQAQTGDIAAVLRIEQTLSTAPHWPETAYAAAFDSSLRCFLVAQEDGELIGFAVASILAGEAELETIAVRETSQGQGIGGKLVEEILRWARSRGAEAAMLEVRSASHAARQLYTRAGFEVVGARRRYYKDPPDDAVLMRWPSGLSGALAGRNEGEV